MIKSHLETKEFLVIDDIICNKCGETCRLESDFGYEGLQGCDIMGGYGSKYLGDMNRYVFDVCEKCLVEWFDTFKIDPQTKI